MALRSAHRLPNETMSEADKTLHVGARGGEEEPLRQECAWIGRGSFSNGGGKKIPRMFNLNRTFQAVRGETGPLLLRSHREAGAVG